MTGRPCKKLGKEKCSPDKALSPLFWGLLPGVPEENLKKEKCLSYLLSLTIPQPRDFSFSSPHTLLYHRPVVD